jgi:hypothetical protein
MKKFQTMMAVVLVALMAFAVQSCGSDKDDDNQSYKLEVSLKITDKGPLTDAQCEALIMAAAKGSTVADHPSDASAETATMRAAQLISESLVLDKEALGNAVLTYTLVCTKVSGGKQIVTYYVEFNKGNVRTYNNKN